MPVAVEFQPVEKRVTVVIRIAGQSGDQMRERDAADAPHPMRQVTLIGAAGARGDFSQAGSPFSNQLDRSPRSEIYDVTSANGVTAVTRFAGVEMMP
jgi:hypothetical protein